MSHEFSTTVTKERKVSIEDIAAATFKKDIRINIRLSGRDLSALQRRALKEGISYQMLVASVLHKYVSGSLYDVTANKTH